jgi:hypothetical protein
MVDFLEQRGIAGASVLEVGGGVGEIHLELLRRGATRAVNLELSPAYETERSACCALPVWMAGWSGDWTTSRRILALSSRPTWSCCTGSSAATRTTSDC